MAPQQGTVAFGSLQVYSGGRSTGISGISVLKGSYGGADVLVLLPYAADCIICRAPTMLPADTKGGRPQGRGVMKPDTIS